MKHYPAISEEDLRRLYYSNVFDITNPNGLFKKVFFEVLLYMYCRCRENLRTLTKEDFAIGTDESGRKYVHLYKDALRQQRHEDDTGRMYEIPGSPSCPLLSFNMYVNKLNPECSAFFQQPKSKFKFDDPIWYTKIPLGMRALGFLMRLISKEAHLSQIYTNHSIKRTCVAVLQNSTSYMRHTDSVLGECSEQGSVRSACHIRASRRRHVSDILSQSLGLQTLANPGTPVQAEYQKTCRICYNMYLHSEDLKPLSSETFDDSFVIKLKLLIGPYHQNDGKPQYLCFQCGKNISRVVELDCKIESLCRERDSLWETMSTARGVAPVRTQENTRSIKPSHAPPQEKTRPVHPIKKRMQTKSTPQHNSPMTSQKNVTSAHQLAMSTHSIRSSSHSLPTLAVYSPGQAQCIVRSTTPEKIKAMHPLPQTNAPMSMNREILAHPPSSGSRSAWSVNLLDLPPDMTERSDMQAGGAHNHSDEPVSSPDRTLSRTGSAYHNISQVSSSGVIKKRQEHCYQG